MVTSWCLVITGYKYSRILYCILIDPIENLAINGEESIPNNNTLGFIFTYSYIITLFAFHETYFNKTVLNLILIILKIEQFKTQSIFLQTLFHILIWFLLNSMKINRDWTWNKMWSCVLKLYFIKVINVIHDRCLVPMTLGVKGYIKIDPWRVPNANVKIVVPEIRRLVQYQAHEASYSLTGITDGLKRQNFGRSSLRMWSVFWGIAPNVALISIGVSPLWWVSFYLRARLPPSCFSTCRCRGMRKLLLTPRLRLQRTRRRRRRPRISVPLPVKETSTLSIKNTFTLLTYIYVFVIVY